MEARAYYNEIDTEACGALRELMALGLIAPGDIDNRSIKDVTADDLIGYTQVHLCAGIGVWSYAARLAGWPDRRPLWTASFPCQPFSAAGKGEGADDPRHLWPDGFRLISARRPAVIMGEQVAGAAGYGWFDGVQSDLASQNFASRTVDIPACSIDAPHIRNRLAWIAERMADAERGERDGRPIVSFGGPEGRSAAGRTAPQRSDLADRYEPVLRQIASAGQLADLERDSGDHGGGDVEHTARERRGQGRAKPEVHRRRPTPSGADVRERHGTVALGDGEGIASRSGLCQGRTLFHRTEFADADGGGDLADSGCGGDEPRSGSIGKSGTPRSNEVPAQQWERGRHDVRCSDGRNSPRSFWADAEWLLCHDEKARRAKPGVRLLVDGAPKRISRWRVAGNAICAPLFVEVVKAYLETAAPSPAEDA